MSLPTLARFFALLFVPSFLIANFAWMDRQIEEDFRPFESTGITLEMLDETIRKIPEISFGGDLVRLKILEGQIYGPDGNAKDLLKKVVSLYPVPDVDVILQNQDIIWNHWILPGPVLSICKIKGTCEKMIHFPVQFWSEWEQIFVNEVEQATLNSPWEAKTPKLFWRGVNNDVDNYNNREDWTKIRRGKLCAFSKAYPETIDAAFSGTYPWLLDSSLEQDFFTFFPKKSASREEFISHKYLIDMDGRVASNGGVWKLLSNCAVFKHDSPYTLWWHRILIPWVHYVPVKEDLSDLFERLLWALYHDEEVKQIAENGRLLAKENFMPEHLYLYCYKVLEKYSSLQRFTPKLTSSSSPALPPPPPPSPLPLPLPK